MVLKRECDRCEKLTTVGLSDEGKFRLIHIDKDRTGKPVTDAYDLCEDCIAKLRDWLSASP